MPDTLTGIVDHIVGAPRAYPPIYDLEIVCDGSYETFPEFLREKFEALIPIATTRHFYIVGMCFVGRGLNDDEIDELQRAEDEYYILAYCCKLRPQGATIAE